MEITLTPELEELVQQQVASGAYSSPNEVVASSLRLLKGWDALERTRLEELRRDLRAAKEQLERGEGKVYDSADQLLEDIVSEGTKRRAEKRNGLAP